MFKATIICISLILGCASHAAAEEFHVHTSHGVLANFTKYIGGEYVSVTMPVPSGVDPAHWMPGIADISAMQEADLILLNGADYEGWADRVSLPRAKTIQTVRASEIDLIRLAGMSHSHGNGPAHTHEGLAAQVWLDFSAAAHQAGVIANALSIRIPTQADSFNQNLQELKLELEQLDALAEAVGRSLEGQSLLVAHSGLEYFARAYNIEMIEATIDPDIFPTSDQWKNIDAIIERADKRVIIWQSLPPAATVLSLLERNTEVVVFDVGVHMGQDESFLVLMQENLNKLQQAVDKNKVRRDQ